jgi:hypothetical protein
MIYIVGMSHIRPVIDACSLNGIDEQLSNIVNESAPEFVNWDIPEDMLPCQVKVANIYIRQTALHWGQTPAQLLSPSVIGMVPGFQKLLQSVESTTLGNILFAFMYGEEYVQMGTRAFNTQHDFELPWRRDLAIAPHRQVIPLEIIEKQVTLHLVKSIANFYAIRSLHPHLRIVNVICPPPSYAGNKVGGNRHSVHFKYYLLYVKLLQAALAPIGIESLLPPSEALTVDGLLASDYVGDDVHGNKRYGEQVLAQIKDMVFQGTH